MKLIFPNGEHAAVELGEGITQIGSGSDCQIVLVAPGVAVNHCEVEISARQAVVRIRDQSVATVLNGRQIAKESPLKPGDLLLFGRIGCRVVASGGDTGRCRAETGCRRRRFRRPHAGAHGLAEVHAARRFGSHVRA